MPYYAYVNGKATVGLATVDQVKDYVSKRYSDYKEADVAIYDMEWTREGQKLITEYKLKNGKQ